MSKPSDSIIWIHIMISDSLDVYTCGGLYCSVKLLPMGFTLSHTMLVHYHLEPLSYQRLGSLCTLTTLTSILYVSLTYFLKFHDATLLESLYDYIHYNTTMKYHQESHEITSNSFHIHISHTKSTCYLKTS